MKRDTNIALKFISNVAGKKKYYILILLLAQSLYGVSGVFFALLLRNIIDGAVGHSINEMVKGIVLFCALIGFQIMLRAIVRYVQELSKATYENAFKERLFRQILYREYGSVSAVHSAEWMNLLTSDTQIVAEGLATIVPGTCEMLAKLTGALVMILVIEPRFGYILVLGGIFFVFFTYTFRKKLKMLHKSMREQDGKLRITLQEYINSLMIIKAFSKEENAFKSASTKMDEHKTARIIKNRFSNICNIGFNAAMQGTYILGAVYGATGIYNGTLSYGSMAAMLQLVDQIQSPFANITGYLPKYYAMIASAERLMNAETMRSDEGIEKSTDSCQPDYIGMENVSFTYKEHYGDSEEPATAVLENFNLTVKQGEFVAFIGPSGCGKSTVLKLLMRMYAPDKGKITAGSRDIFAYVPQGNMLMSGSIREVITFACPEKINDDEELYRALEIACAKDFVMELPNALDTVLGERGCGLSEGQMQRLSISRALLSGRPVLLLDEATSALDEDTAYKLLTNLRKLENITLILVTHRTNHMEFFDKIIMFHSN